MHYFSLHTQQDEHIGFLIMYPRDDSQNQSGDLAIKLLDSLPTRLREVTKLLSDWQVQAALSWEVSGDKVVVFDDDGDPRGTIRQEQLHIGNHVFILNDLAGNM
ncbi:HLGFF motif protein [Kingella kingae]|uniref:HLGFF motif protein n=1 Tax=Kingella kingae TaxID=504 RepID=UPI00042A2591|nr:hypothetical protein [Kingella kingae]MDK4624091.1 hypothetical protein [Kingella kingae]MDK4660757.1 hypothetical protein [Kingella kingae]MDK4668724.1 hypothetical protein [Kingella kingae]MDK4686084.1 hypothetical protein [Kingella kingae]